MPTHISNSEAETQAIAAQLSRQLPNNAIVCLFGDLGAGKTTFVKGLSEGLGIDKAVVTSPTFVYLNIHQGLRTLYHFDLYRLRDSDQFLSMGFDEMLDAGGVCCIEWSERIENLLPSNVIKVTLEHLEESKRNIKIEGL